MSTDSPSIVAALLDAWGVEPDGRDTIVDLRLGADGDIARIMRLSPEPNGEGSIVPASTLQFDLLHPDGAIPAGLVCDALGIKISRLFQLDLRIISQPYIRAVLRRHVFPQDEPQLLEILTQLSAVRSPQTWDLPSI
jgi:hypothetical protein